ncbi:MAG TPA: hypothetical protein VM784_05270 [Actinomycetota bacterium]|nr:hypothetical protein [Actinomycetota bacterium]
MPHEKESQHEGTPEELADGLGGAQSVPSEDSAEQGETAESGGPDAPTPEREMEPGEQPVHSSHGGVSPADGANEKQTTAAEDLRGEG